MSLLLKNFNSPFACGFGSLEGRGSMSMA